MTRITEGHLVRHYQGVKGGRDAALLDIAQDHALHLIHNAGLFEHDLVFKGGTALRKFRAGNAGPFLDRTPVILDGMVVTSAALMAPGVKAWVWRIILIILFKFNGLSVSLLQRYAPAFILVVNTCYCTLILV